MSLPMQRAKRHLAAVWLAGALAILLVLVVQSQRGNYGSLTDQAWGWFLPTIMPTLSLIVGATAADALSRTARGKGVDQSAYWAALVLSIVYLLVVSLTLLMQPLVETTPLELMRMSHLWLGPLQGLVSASLGVFFVAKPQHDAG